MYFYITVLQKMRYTSDFVAIFVFIFWAASHSFKPENSILAE